MSSAGPADDALTDRTPPGAWTLFLLGRTRLSNGQAEVALRPKERAVLAALAQPGCAPISTGEIAVRVWGDQIPATAPKALHNHIARIRQVAPGLIHTSDAGYQLDAAVTLDFERSDSSNPVLFADLADTSSIVSDRYRFQERLAAEQELELGEGVSNSVTPQLLERLHLAVQAEPLRERRWHYLALAQVRLGQRRDALLTLQRARGELASVGLGLGRDLLDLEQTILDGSAEVVVPAAPRIIHRHRNDPFVGRSGELDLLNRLLTTTVADGSVHAAVIHGAAGMGKTRLIDRFVESLPRRVTAVRVLWGRHREVAGRPHEMVHDTLSRLFDEEPALIEAAADDLNALRAIFPDLAPLNVPAPTMNESMVMAHVAHAVSSVIGRVAVTPTVWFIDDAQWATDESIEVVERVVESTRGPLLIIVGTRPAGSGHNRAVAVLDRLAPTSTIDLYPFSVDELAELLDEPANGVPTRLVHPIETIRAVHERTGGLPLYASEIARHARLTGTSVSPGSAPGTIRDWVHHHVSALDTDARRLLEVAAVIGDNVDLNVLVAASGRSVGEASGAIDRLVAIGLLAATDASGVHFSHELTRDIVYDHIGVAARSRLHLSVARAIETDAHGDDSLELAALAHHYSLAGSESRSRAVEYSERAGKFDLSMGAWSSAAAHFQRAAAGAATTASRMRALIGAGRSLLGGGNFEQAEATLREAVEMARVDGDAIAQAEATVVLVGRAGRGAALDASDEVQIAMLRSALRNLERIDRRGDRLVAILRSTLERELAYALLLSDAESERGELLFGAVNRIERLDPVPADALAQAVLGSRYAKLDGPDIAERLSDIDRVLSLPSTEVGAPTLLAAHCYHNDDLLRIGDLAAASDALDHAAAISRSYPDPYWIWSIATWRALQSLIMGDLDGAERGAWAARAERPNVAAAAACLGVNLVNIRLYQGRSGEVIDLLRSAVDENPEIPAYRAVLALCASESGQREQADDDLKWFTTARFANLHRDSNRLLALAVLAHVAADVGDKMAARQLLELLEPFAGQWAILACYGGGGASWGPVDHAIGRLLATLDDHAGARRRMVRAKAMAARAPLALDRIDADLARLQLDAVSH